VVGCTWIHVAAALCCTYICLMSLPQTHIYICLMSLLPARHARFKAMQIYFSLYIYTYTYIAWFWDPIFRTNWDVRDVDKRSWDLPIVWGPHWGKCAILVWSAHLWLSWPDLQNQSIIHIYLYICSIRLPTDGPSLSLRSCSVPWMCKADYGVAMINRLLKMIGLFCRI